jgi:hypothetical protein
MPNNAGNPTSIHSSMRYLVLRAAQKLPMRKIPLSLSLAFLAAMILTALPAIARASHVLRQTEHATPPTRDPNNPGYVKAVELSDGANPLPSVDGNFILGPTHKAETPEQRAEVAGKVVKFTQGTDPATGEKSRPKFLRNRNGRPSASRTQTASLSTHHP